MPWVWCSDVNRYRDEETGRFASAAQVRAWGQTSMDASANAAIQRSQGLADGDTTLSDWQRTMREEIKKEYIKQYLLGIGGRDKMTQADWGSVGGMIADQYRYLDGFAAEIASGELSEGRIAARAAMYLASAREAFERANRRMRGVAELPAYPGDGGTRCLTNCRCYWEIVRKGDVFDCHWTLTSAEHCPDCIERSGKWNPLTVKAA